MPNPNKTKGDRAERAARDYLQQIWPTTRTRAGYNRDIGDLICDTPRGLLVIQVKDVANPNFKKWFAQLEDQIANLREIETRPILGGIILWKLRGQGPHNWRTITPLHQLPNLLQP